MSVNSSIRECMHMDTSAGPLFHSSTNLASCKITVLRDRAISATYTPYVSAAASPSFELLSLELLSLDSPQACSSPATGAAAHIGPGAIKRQKHSKTSSPEFSNSKIPLNDRFWL